MNRSRFIEDFHAVSRPPFVARDNPAVILVGFSFPHLDASDDAVARSFGPKIDAFHVLDFLLELDALRNHVTMTKPGRFLVHVVGAVAWFGLLHRPGAR